MAVLAGLPWYYIAIGYTGLVLYLILSLANPKDESFSAIGDVFLHKGKTVLAGVLATPLLVLAAKSYGQLNEVAALACGYLNVSLIRKVAEIGQAKLGAKDDL